VLQFSFIAVFLEGSLDLHRAVECATNYSVCTFILRWTWSPANSSIPKFPSTIVLLIPRTFPLPPDWLVS